MIPSPLFLYRNFNAYPYFICLLLLLVGVFGIILFVNLFIMIRKRNYKYVVGETSNIGGISEWIKFRLSSAGKSGAAGAGEIERMRYELADLYFNCMVINRELNDVRYDARTKAFISLFAMLLFAFCLSVSISTPRT